MEEEHVGRFKCNLIEANYKIKHRRKTAFCLIAEQIHHMPKKGFIYVNIWFDFDLRLLISLLSYVTLIQFLINNILLPQ